MKTIIKLEIIQDDKQYQMRLEAGDRTNTLILNQYFADVLKFKVDMAIVEFMDYVKIMAKEPDSSGYYNL